MTDRKTEAQRQKHHEHDKQMQRRRNQCGQQDQSGHQPQPVSVDCSNGVQQAGFNVLSGNFQPYDRKGIAQYQADHSGQCESKGAFQAVRMATVQRGETPAATSLSSGWQIDFLL